MTAKKLADQPQIDLHPQSFGATLQLGLVLFPMFFVGWMKVSLLLKLFL